MPIERWGYVGPRVYGNAHQKARAKLKPYVDAGMCTCARCGETIQPGDKWDLDHAPDRQSYLGPSHARCNRSAQGF